MDASHELHVAVVVAIIHDSTGPGPMAEAFLPPPPQESRRIKTQPRMPTAWHFRLIIGEAISANLWMHPQ